VLTDVDLDGRAGEFVPCSVPMGRQVDGAAMRDRTRTARRGDIHIGIPTSPDCAAPTWCAHAARPRLVFRRSTSSTAQRARQRLLPGRSAGCRCGNRSPDAVSRTSTSRGDGVPWTALAGRPRGRTRSAALGRAAATRRDRSRTVQRARVVLATSRYRPRPGRGRAGRVAAGRAGPRRLGRVAVLHQPELAAGTPTASSGYCTDESHSTPRPRRRRGRHRLPLCPRARPVMTATLDRHAPRRPHPAPPSVPARHCRGGRAGRGARLRLARAPASRSTRSSRLARHGRLPGSGGCRRTSRGRGSRSQPARRARHPLHRPLLGTTFSIPSRWVLALLGSRATTRNVWVYQASRSLLSLLRAIPDWCSR